MLPIAILLSSKTRARRGQLAILYEFFTGLPFWRLQPFHGVKPDAVALTDADKLYVIYLPHGGKAELDLPAAARTMQAQWFDPRTGKYRPAPVVQSGATVSLRAPDENDWTLLLKQ